jgi:hypothetical protein
VPCRRFCIQPLSIASGLPFGHPPNLPLACTPPTKYPTFISPPTSLSRRQNSFPALAQSVASGLSRIAPLQWPVSLDLTRVSPDLGSSLRAKPRQLGSTLRIFDCHDHEPNFPNRAFSIERSQRRKIRPKSAAAIRHPSRHPLVAPHNGHLTLFRSWKRNGTRLFTKTKGLPPSVPGRAPGSLSDKSCCMTESYPSCTSVISLFRPQRSSRI